jgi:4'-phosphopantetheinyl transferase
MAAIEVHVWTVQLRPDESALAHLEKLLSQAELSRADRFHFSKDRQAHIAAHASLRLILASYLNRNPLEIVFTEGLNGKPAVPGIQFNLSHSAGLAIVAVTRDRELGVDVEHVDSERADLRVAQRFFSPSEFSVLQALPTEHQAEAFFNCWTRKEAYLKAIGLGLSVPLDSFDVTLAPGEQARLLRGADSRWRLRSFSPAPSYIAALAIDAPEDEVIITLRACAGLRIQ